MTEEMKKAISVGEVRKLIAGLPDEAGFFPDWGGDPPGDSDPAVEIFGFAVKDNPWDKKPGIAILVGLQSLDEIEDEDEDEDEDD